MPAGQRERRLLVLVEVETGCLEGSGTVTLFASVAPRRSGKLARMFVFVTVNALCECNFEFCFFSCWRVARRALYRCVGKGQWEARLGVIGYRER